MKHYPARRQSDGEIIWVYQAETVEELEEVNRRLAAGETLTEILPDPMDLWAAEGGTPPLDDDAAGE